MNKRSVVRSVSVVVGLAAVAAAVLVSAGSAGTTTKPYTANLCDALVGSVCPEPTPTPPALPGGSAVVYLTLHNKANPQTLGSANIGLPTGPSPTTYTGASISFGTGDITRTDTLVTLRNLNLAPNGFVTVQLTLSTPVCTSGTYDWSSAVQVKQSNSFNGPPGNDFTRTTPSSLTASLSGGGCHLAVVSGHQPQDTIKMQPITDALFSSGGAVQVGLYDSGNNLVSINGTCPAGPGCVTAAFGGGDSTATLSGTKQRALIGGIASFSGLSLNKSSNDLYRMTFASPGVTGATSDDFAITDTGTLCNPGTNPCSLSSTFTGNGSTPTTSSDVSTTFSTTGGLSLTFFTGGLPTAVIAPGGGCANFVPTSSPGVTLGIHGTTGTATIDYGISDKALKQRYGPNYGQPTVPICVGALRLTAAGVKIPCESDSGGGWTGKALGSDGRLNGQFETAVCDPTTHLWWSVAPTFQDNQTPPGFSPLSIEITQWGGQTAPDGTNLRLFTITKPNPWDYTMRG